MPKVPGFLQFTVKTEDPTAITRKKICLRAECIQGVRDEGTFAVLIILYPQAKLELVPVNESYEYCLLRLAGEE